MFCLALDCRPLLRESVEKVVNKILDVLIVAAATVAVIVAISEPKTPTDEPSQATYRATATHTTPEKTETTQVLQKATRPTTTETEPQEPTAEEFLPLEEETITLYDVPLATDLQMHIIRTAEEYGIDPAIIFAIAYRESTFNASIIGDNGNSLGLMQVQPYWHGERMTRLGCTDLLDPFQNVTVAVDYLAELLGWYGGDMAKALTAYNRGSYQGTITEYATAVLAISEELRGTTYESTKHQFGPKS